LIIYEAYKGLDSLEGLEDLELADQQISLPSYLLTILPYLNGIGLRIKNGKKLIILRFVFFILKNDYFCESISHF
jgi:hypothetical protein